MVGCRDGLVGFRVDWGKYYELALDQIGCVQFGTLHGRGAAHVTLRYSDEVPGVTTDADSVEALAVALYGPVNGRQFAAALRGEVLEAPWREREQQRAATREVTP